MYSFSSLVGLFVWVICCVVSLVETIKDRGNKEAWIHSVVLFISTTMLVLSCFDRVMFVFSSAYGWEILGLAVVYFAFVLC